MTDGGGVVALTVLWKQFELFKHLFFSIVELFMLSLAVIY